ncbi:MAG: ribosome-associated translation inhibitor RaiA [Candidatus Omnitrophica bacterium]|nr:ribosome-associated translation inhibitor RaiA [Candidatus Omnitrophota bacterium]
MQITVTARHMEVTPGLREHVERHLSKLNRYNEHIMNAHVILEIEKFRNIVEITLSLKKIVMKVKEATSDIYTSVDLAVKKLETKLVRYDEKIKTHRVKGHRGE